MDASHETSGVREIDLSQLDDNLTEISAETPDLSGSPKNKLQEDLSGWGIEVPRDWICWGNFSCSAKTSSGDQFFKH